MRNVECNVEDIMDRPDVTAVDWKADAGGALEKIDELLGDLGLEIVIYDDGTDMLTFSVEKKA